MITMFQTCRGGTAKPNGLLCFEQIGFVTVLSIAQQATEKNPLEGLGQNQAWFLFI